MVETVQLSSCWHLHGEDVVCSQHDAVSSQAVHAAVADGHSVDEGLDEHREPYYSSVCHEHVGVEAHVHMNWFRSGNALGYHWVGIKGSGAGACVCLLLQPVAVVVDADDTSNLQLSLNPVHDTE